MEKYTKEQFQEFHDRCYQRARQIWWEVRPTIAPSSLLNIITEDDDKLYMEYMDARENIIEAMFTAQEELYLMANSPDGIVALPTKESKEAVDFHGADVVQRARELYKVMKAQLKKYRSKKEEKPDAADTYYKKFEKQATKLVHNRRNTSKSKKKSAA